MSVPIGGSKCFVEADWVRDDMAMTVVQAKGSGMIPKNMASRILPEEP
jgi:hypothetical protein